MWWLVLFVSVVVLVPGCILAIPKHPGGTNQHIEEDAGLFEGDIHIRPSFRNAVPDLGKTWPGGIVPYAIDSASDYSEYQTGVFKKAIDRIEEATAVNGKKCVQFVPRNGERDYLFIKKVKGCSSDVGRQRGKQELSLSFGCFLKGSVMHELMHSLGFWHEQSRADRDDYITILWDNIKKDHFSNFNRKTNVEVHHLGLPYDYNSIMHYSETAFTKNDKVTIFAHDPRAVIGQRDDLSPIDIKKIQILYGCVEGDRPTIHTEDKKLPGKKVDDAVFHCDFENGLCGIEVGGARGVKWTLDSSLRQAGEDTGPNGDHTTGTGTYAVVRNRGTFGTSVALFLPTLEPSENGYCIDLWYNLYGQEAGMFSVEDGGMGLDTIIGDQGGDWAHGQFTTTKRGEVDPSLVAIWGPDTVGDVAVDDISIFKGPC